MRHSALCSSDAHGLGDGDRSICVNAAKDAGWVTFMSESRGEGGSEGAIEVCLGEADDVIALAECAMQEPYVAPTPMLMAGGSHGGCITLRAVQKGAPVAAAVDVFGPTDLKKEHEFGLQSSLSPRKVRSRRLFKC